MRPVKGYEGVYLVSSDGKVFSVARPSARGGELKNYKAAHGYCRVSLCKDGKSKLVYVHDLVAAAYIGEKPDGHQVRHINGDGFDNRVENLAYGTQSDNEADKVSLGLANRGSRHGMSKLTELAVEQIKKMDGVRLKDLALMFGVSETTVHNIRKGKAWVY